MAVVAVWHRWPEVLGSSGFAVHLVYFAATCLTTLTCIPPICAALGESLQTIQTAYKPSYKPFTALGESLQTIQTVYSGGEYQELALINKRFVWFVSISRAR